ncbi:MAG: carbohydrate ABC transporter permease [Armatimonadetes bacterium]|nr:carbohydrate ABC transporter permease [Armatimonadota bacterium]
MKKNQALKYLLYLVLISIALLTMAPFLVSVSASLKPAEKALEWPPNLIPSPFTLDNYAKVWQVSPFFPKWLVNSVFLAIVHVICQLLFCSMAGYAFARLSFPGKKLLFLATLGSMMIPAQATMISNYAIANSLGWVNTFYAVIVPGAAGAFGIFLMTQFFKGIPRELEEAAHIDGCSRLLIFWRIILPLATPALGALAIFSFQGSWNGFMWPLIVLNTPENFTLPLGLNYFRSEYATDWALVLAGSMFNSVPIILIFLFFQRYFIKGIATTGLK